MYGSELKLLRDNVQAAWRVTTSCVFRLKTPTSQRPRSASALRARAGCPVSGVGLRGRSVLVTGAYGLLGSWPVKALVSDGATHDRAQARGGWSPLALEARGDGATGQRRAWRYLRCAADREVLSATNTNWTAVFHLAAQTIVGVAKQSPLSTFETNVGGT
jgi:FlaA1/EpsC-like NDP-sugar epimerase